MNKQLTYERKGDKVILCKDGVYMGLDLDQLLQLKQEILPRVLQDWGYDQWTLRESPNGNEVETD